MVTKPLAAVVWANASRLIGLAPGQSAEIRDMVNRTGLPLGNLQRIRDGGNPTLNTIAQLAAALRVDAHVLFQPDDDGATRVAEPAAAYGIRTDEALIDSLAELVARIPTEARTAFADVVAGWIVGGGEASRASALLALMQIGTKRSRVA